MIQELLPLVKNTPINEFVDIQVLNRGLYVLIDESGNIISENIKNDNKSLEDSVWEEQFKRKYFFSQILNSNKSIVYKKPISSNNPYSFVTWQINFVDKTYVDLINLYFEKQKEYNPNVDLEKYKQAILKAGSYIEDNVYNYFSQLDKKTNQQKVKDIKKNRISIYINVSDSEYEKTFMNYIEKKLFVDNQYNICVNDIILGIPTLNNAYDSKKPYIKHLTQANPIAYQCSLEDAIEIYKLYDWLKNQTIFSLANKKTSNLKLKINSSILEIANENEKRYFLVKGDVLRTMQGTEYIIEDFQVINDVKDSINYSNVHFLETDCQLPNIRNFKEFEDFVNKELYSFTFYNKETKVTDKMNSNLVAHLRQYRGLFENCFKYTDLGILGNKMPKAFSNIAFDYTKIAIKDNDNEKLYFRKIAIILTTLYNMIGIEELNIKKGKEMQNTMNNMLDNLREKLAYEDSTPTSENMEEYCFAVGQLTRYLVSKSKAKNKTFKLAEPILSCTKKQKLDNVLKNMIMKYSHSLSFNKKLTNLIALTTTVNFENEKINKDMLLAGFVANNLIYEKTEQNDENAEVENNEEE